MSEKKKVPCTIMRGGTSKGLFFLEEDLPKEEQLRDKLLLEVMGSPDKKQINGLGGATSVTSKVAILRRSQREDADVDYTFCQVSVDKPLVSLKGNCGNISSGVGPFAIEKGLVEGVEPITKVRIFNTNTNKIIEEEVPFANGSVVYDGDYAIAGVPGTASPLKLSFVEPAGSMPQEIGQGQLLPTGNVVDTLDVPGLGELEVSIVDAANPLVFVKAKDISLRGDELPEEIDQSEKWLELLERIRGVAAVKLGLCSDYRKSAWETPGIPKMTFVAEAADYVTTSGEKIAKEDIDLLSRMMSMQKTHPNYAMTGAMCTAAAAVIPGSVVNQVLRKDWNKKTLRIAHPGGVIDAGVSYEETQDGVKIHSTFGYRTAKLLMDGVAYYHEDK